MYGGKAPLFKDLIKSLRNTSGSRKQQSCEYAQRILQMQTYLYKDITDATPIPQTYPNEHQVFKTIVTPHTR